MPWTCRLIENPELDEYGNVDISKRATGDMWFLNAPIEDLHRRHLTDEYFSINSNRKPLVVLLPGNNYFLIDGKCYSGKCERCGKWQHACACPEPSTVKGYYGGWNVQGVPPAITVAPSINFEGRYHGFLIAGVISDDCEGRKFDQ